MRGLICIKIDNKSVNKSLKQIMDESIQVLGDYWRSKGADFDIGYNPSQLTSSDLSS